MLRRGARPALFLLLAALALPGAGCARLFGSYDVAPNGLNRDDDRLRSLLASGQAAVALDEFEPFAPDDDVLGALYRGVVAYHAGDYARSAAILDTAGYLADDRITKSISRSALALVSNDLALPYEPGRTERLMIPYYAALARLKLGDTNGAAVEARRLSLLLQQFADAGADLDPPLAATLRYFAGAVFETAGDFDDAGIAYRNAAALDSTLQPPTVSTGNDGTVVLVLEQGFVAHRVEQGLAVMLLPEEVRTITGGDADEKAAAAAFVAGRILHRAALQHDFYEPRRRGTLYVAAPDRRDLPYTVRDRKECAPKERTDSAQTKAEERKECDDDDELPYLLKVAWPIYRAQTRPLPATLIADADTIGLLRSADVSKGVVADFDDERLLIVARTIARGTAKLALARGASSHIEEKNETAGQIIGLLGNIGNVLTERADTRSWHLLPAGITVARVRLPPGEHRLTLTFGDARTLSLEPIEVRSGQTAILPVRVW